MKTSMDGFIELKQLSPVFLFVSLQGKLQLTYYAFYNTGYYHTYGQVLELKISLCKTRAKITLKLLQYLVMMLENQVKVLCVLIDVSRTLQGQLAVHSTTLNCQHWYEC